MTDQSVSRGVYMILSAVQMKPHPELTEADEEGKHHRRKPAQRRASQWNGDHNFSPPCDLRRKDIMGGLNSSLVIDLPVVLSIVAIMCLPALKKGELKRWQGILLLCIYATFTVY